MSANRTDGRITWLQVNVLSKWKRVQIHLTGSLSLSLHFTQVMVEMQQVHSEVTTTTLNHLIYP